MKNVKAIVYKTFCQAAFQRAHLFIKQTAQLNIHQFSGYARVSFTVWPTTRALMLIIMHSVSSSQKAVVQARRHLTANTAHSNIKRLVIPTDMLY